MITRKVKLAFVDGLDLIYIHKSYPLSHTGLHSHSPQKHQPHTPTHGQIFFLGRATVSQKTLVINLMDLPIMTFEIQILLQNLKKTLTRISQHLKLFELSPLLKIVFYIPIHVYNVFWPQEEGWLINYSFWCLCTVFDICLLFLSVPWWGCDLQGSSTNLK